jgi:hypothetical protein
MSKPSSVTSISKIVAADGTGEQGDTRHPAEIFSDCGGRMTLLACGGVNLDYVAAGK